MTLAAIVAMTPERVIGADNQIPWYLPADLKYFKRVTLGHPVIMGRKCFESIGRPLPKRTNVVLTRDPFYRASGVAVVHDPREALRVAAEASTGGDGDEGVAFVIGGAEIYALYWAQTERLYLTEVDADVTGDVYFPPVTDDEWALESSEPQLPDDKNPFPYTFNVYRRRPAEP